jgi:hypothetical protein
MDIFLWLLQIILAIKFLSVSINHGLRQSRAEMQNAKMKLGKSAPVLLKLAALGSLIGVLGLVLPGLLRTWGFLLPLAAAWLAVMLLAGMILHLRSREKPKIFADVILLMMAVIVAYGRWMLFPFS